MQERLIDTRIRVLSAAFALIAACQFTGNARAVVLYNGSLGTGPAAQGWTTAIFPFVQETVGDGGVTLDTTFGNALQSGYLLVLPNGDSDAGFSVFLRAQIISESHSGNSNRAGFNVILLNHAHQGIELGFWTDQIWAQGVDFTRAESAAFDTTSMTAYRLTLQADKYPLSANAPPLVAGPLRDYSAFGAPYDIDHFLFLGDDTTSAQARVKIVEVAAVPLPPAGLLILGPMGGAGVVKLIRRTGPVKA